MALLENGRVVADEWAVADAEAPLPEGRVIVPLARLEEAAQRNAPLGVAIGNDVDPDVLAPFLARLSLVQLHIPGSRDGRAFTQLRKLREYLGFTGEIRIAGHVIPDHWAMLTRLGASSAVVQDGTDPAVWEASRRVVSIAYQHAQAPAEPLALLRRKVA